MAMRMHEREVPVHKASLDLKERVLDWVKKDHGIELTTAEEIMIVTTVFSELITGAMKYAIREERHGDVETPGGIQGNDENEGEGTSVWD